MIKTADYRAKWRCILLASPKSVGLEFWEKGGQQGLG